MHALFDFVIRSSHDSEVSKVTKYWRVTFDMSLTFEKSNL